MSCLINGQYALVLTDELNAQNQNKRTHFTFVSHTVDTLVSWGDWSITRHKIFKYVDLRAILPAI